MKSRKIICLVIAFSLLFMTLSHAETEKKTINFTLANENGELRMRVSTASDHYTIDLPEGIKSQDLFAIIRPDVLPILTDCFAETVMDWNNVTEKKIQEGFFSGDLFEQASEKQVISMNKEDMMLLLRDFVRLIQEKESDAETNTSIERVMQLFISQICGNKTMTSICTYDQGSFLTINIDENHNTKLIISADLSEKDACHILIGRSTGNMIYYDEISCKKIGKETDYVFSLFRTTAPSFRMVSEQDCVQFAEIRLTEQDDETFEFMGEIQSVLLPEEAKITGNISTRDKIIYIEMNIEDNQEIFTKKVLPMLFSLMSP